MGERHRACRAAACQAKRRARQQAAWRRRNPDYFAARRIQEKAQVPRPEPPAVRAPLDRLPWDVAQTQFAVEGAEFLAIFGRLLVKRTQTPMRAQARDTS